MVTTVNAAPVHAGNPLRAQIWPGLRVSRLGKSLVLHMAGAQAVAGPFCTLSLTKGEAWRGPTLEALRADTHLETR